MKIRKYESTKMEGEKYESARVRMLSKLKKVESGPRGGPARGSRYSRGRAARQRGRCRGLWRRSPRKPPTDTVKLLKVWLPVRSAPSRRVQLYQ